jgi:Zn-dependent protease
MLFVGLGPYVFYLLLALLVAIDVHEFCHALVANLLGDPTAKERGRLSLNPFAHLDPLGTLSILLLGLGWGKPVPVDASRLRPNQKVGMALVAIGGPLANIITAAIASIPLRMRLKIFTPRIFIGFPIIYGDLLSWIICFNLALAIFNIIPVTPLDGSRVLSLLLPSRWFRFLARYERYGFILVLFLIILERFTGFGILTSIMRPAIKFSWDLLTNNLTPPDAVRGLLLRTL